MTADRVGVADAPPEMQGPGIDAPPSAEVAVHQRPIVGAFDVPRSDPAVSTRELADLAQGLAKRLSSSLPPDAGPLEIDRRRLVEALRCPARAEAWPDGPFEWSAVKAHRRLGLRALRAMHRSGQQYPDALEGAARAIELEIDEGTRLGEWLARLSPAGRSAVLAAASGFAARHWIALPWDRCRRVQFGSHRHRVPLPEPAEQVTLDLRLDATIFVSDPPVAERVIVSMGQTPPEALRFDTLASSLHLMRAPSTRHFGRSRGRAAELRGRRRSPSRGRGRRPRSGREGAHGPDERRRPPGAPRIGVPPLPEPGPLRPRRRLGGRTDPPGRRHSGGGTPSYGVFERGLGVHIY